MALWDLENADCIVVMGSNMAENHPVGFRFVVEAQRRGATVIHVDPRFTRTSALANIHAPIRSGTDIAFLGGIIHHILENDLWFRDFVLAYTNIANIIEDGYQDPEQTGGVFSGFNADTGSYKQDTWQYKGKIVPSSISEHRVQTQEKSRGGDFEAMTEGPPPTDPTLQHPNCVYQIMRRHYARYTPEMVERVTGCPQDTFLAVANALTRNSGREKTGAFCYAVGWTHHTVGVQIIRAAAIIQGLLGNIGRPGGGILALRGHASIQGSTDIPTLYNMLPTYLPQPNVFHQHGTLQNYLDSETPTTGWWANMPKYVVSLLKAWYGEHARPDNEWGYQFVPKLTGDVSQLPMTLSMLDGVMKGQFILGQNPVVGAVNSDLVERGLAKLDWLVVRDFAMTETANFWQKGQLVQRGELRPEEIDTEVFFLPASLAGEKDGTVTNTSRLVQWHDAVLEPPGDSRSDLWFIYHLGKRLKQLYADSTEPRDAAIQALTWTYPERGKRAEPEAEAVLREINGYTVADRKQIPSYQQLKDDGSTACGGWMYCGVYPSEGHNVARSRKPDAPGGPGSHAGWAFSWPSNRRTLYNRASADLDGRPWSERKKMVWWDEAAGKWTGNDVPDFAATKRPDYRPDWPTHPHGMDSARRRRSIHHGSRRQVPVVRAVRPEGWSPADALRAGGKSGAQCDVRPAVQPGRQAVDASWQRIARAARSAVSVRVHHVSTHRTALRRRHQPGHATHRRTAAGGVRRNLSRTRPGTRHSPPGLDGAVHPAWRDRGARHGDRADAAVQDRGPDGASGRHAVGVRLGGLRPRGHRQRVLAITGDANTSILIRFAAGPSSVKRIGHAVLGSPKNQETVRWFRETLGLVCSDDVYAGDTENIIGQFSRIDAGDDYVDHHAFFCMRNERAGLNHFSFEVQDVDDVFIGHEYLNGLSKYEHMWGIGRHLLGSQVYDYWADPWGRIHEHWADNRSVKSPEWRQPRLG